MCSGKDSKCSGVKGCVLFLIERNERDEIIGHKSVFVDGKKYKEGEFYKLEKGRVVKA